MTKCQHGNDVGSLCLAQRKLAKSMPSQHTYIGPTKLTLLAERCKPTLAHDISANRAYVALLCRLYIGPTVEPMLCQRSALLGQYMHADWARTTTKGEELHLRKCKKNSCQLVSVCRPLPCKGSKPYIENMPGRLWRAPTFQEGININVIPAIARNSAWFTTLKETEQKNSKHA